MSKHLMTEQTAVTTVCSSYSEQTAIETIWKNAIYFIGLFVGYIRG